jgi:hypothetical protein
MAGITSSFRLPEPEEFDYSKSHREVPIPSVGYSSTHARRAPDFGTEPGQPRERVGESQREGAGAEGKRRGSFSSLLHRSTSHSTTPADAPPVPATRIGQAHAQAAAAREEVGGSQFDIVSGNRNIGRQPYERNVTSPTSSQRVVVGESGNKMLRKSSKVRQAEQERLAREAAAQQQQTPRQPPRLPSMPNLQEQDDTRPDSFAIFNSGQYQTSSGAAPPLPHGAPANFSRPGNTSNMPSSTFNNSSSSPGYALRPGNAFAQQATSSPATSAQAKNANGEYVIAGAPIDRSESMAHRGRYSYASTGGQAVNAVNSPRRVRRRKDPTPFK